MGPAFGSERLLEDLRVALEVVQRGARCWQAIDADRLEAALAEPVGGTGGEDDEFLQPELACALLDAFEQLVAATTVAVLGIDCQTGQLASVRVGDRIQRRAGVPRRCAAQSCGQLCR